MQITIDQNEITEAIETYVRGQVAIADDQEIGIDLRAGRGDNGFTATLDIRPAAKKGNVKKPAPVTTRRATTPIETAVAEQVNTALQTATVVEDLTEQTENVVGQAVVREVSDETQGISSGEDRPDPANPEVAETVAETKPATNIFGKKPTTVIKDEVADAEPADAPAPDPVKKAASIFNFAKKETVAAE